MGKEESHGIPQTRNYKLAALEQALVTLRRDVVRPQDYGSIHFTPTQKMMLLEAARVGLACFYTSPDLLKNINYPFP